MRVLGTTQLAGAYEDGDLQSSVHLRRQTVMESYLHLELAKWAGLDPLLHLHRVLLVRVVGVVDTKDGTEDSFVQHTLDYVLGMSRLDYCALKRKVIKR